MWFVGLVPGDTPCKNLTENPPPGVGPYKVTESVPNRQFVLEKNKNWPDLGPDFPKGHVDKITDEDRQERRASGAGRDLRRARLHAGPAAGGHQAGGEVEVLGSLSRDHDRFDVLHVHEQGGRRPSTRRKCARRSTSGLDKPALARLFAGEVAPGCSFLPPGQPGYNKALDTTDCPWGDPNKPPDMEKARQMIKDAGVGRRWM